MKELLSVTDIVYLSCSGRVDLLRFGNLVIIKANFFMDLEKGDKK